MNTTAARVACGLTALVLACSGAMAQDTTPSKDETGAPGAPRIKEIGKLAPRASVVLDRNCPQIVQPYSLTDNVASLAMFSAGEKGKDLLANAGSFIGGLVNKDGGGAKPASSNIGESTRLAAKQLNWLPMPAEVEFGARMHKEQEAVILARDSKLGRKVYPVADEMMKEVLAGVGEKTDYDFKLYVLKNATRNAVARPGGYIYLDQGLVDAPAQKPKAYFALAHEVAHVLQRHETKELQSYAVDSFTVKDELLKAMVTARSDPGMLLSKVKLEKNQFTQHHVDQELQADSCAARILNQALDRKALAASLDAFIADLPPPSPDAPAATARNAAERYEESVHEIVDSPVQRHPNSEERRRNLQAIVAEIKPGGRPAAP